MPGPSCRTCRRNGITPGTFYRWKAKFAGMEVSDAKKLKALEDENRRLKHLVADLTLDNQALKSMILTKMVRPAAYRQAVGLLEWDFDMSERRACRLLGFGRASHRYVSTRTAVQSLLDDMRMHAAARPRFGYRRIHVLLRREGWAVNHKRVYRLCRADGLAVRRKRRKRLAAGIRTMLPAASRPNERWSMDFTLDTMASGRKFRTFNIVDDFTRECLAIEADTSIGGARVARVLSQLVAERGPPTVIVSDNGPQFAGRVLDR